MATNHEDYVHILMGIKEDTGYIRGKVEGLDTRVASLEQARVRDDWKGWLKATILVPVFFAGRYLLRKLGLML